MTTKYTIGVVAVTNGSNIVVGTGTKWLSSLAAAVDLFSVAGGKQYDIAKVIDDTHISLSVEFREVSASAQVYAIERNFANTTLKEVAEQVMAIGEYKSNTVAIGSAVAETTATPVDVTTIALTAGEWDVSGVINRSLTGVTATQYAAAISPADTVPAQAGGSGVAADSSIIQNAAFGATVSGNYVSRVGPVRVSLTADATIHLVAADTFSAGTIGLFGTIEARRIR